MKCKCGLEMKAEIMRFEGCKVPIWQCSCGDWRDRNVGDDK